MDDLVKRLRKHAEDHPRLYIKLGVARMCDDAADLIESQAAELTELRAQLISDQGQYIEETGARQEHISRLSRCLCFFASVIKSGERWSATCEAEFRDALSVKQFPESLPVPGTCKED